MDKIIAQGQLAATVNLDENQVQQIIVDHIKKSGKVDHLLAANVVVYFNWHTSKWSDDDKLCTITYVNTND